MTVSFAERLTTVFDGPGRLCVGIDPHAWLLTSWGLPDSADGALEFGLRVVDATAGSAGIVKPQVAFFERFGSLGFAALERVISSAREQGLLVIADAKRGDVGSSVDAYAEAWLGTGSPLESDAVTLNPFQGVGSLTGPLELADRNGKGVFVLAATSNPEGIEQQQAKLASGLTLARSILDDVTSWNEAHAAGPLGSAGVVLGATLDLTGFELGGARTPTPPVLAPGFGHQGASVSDLAAIYGPLAPGVVVSESRALLAAGPDGIRQAVATRAEEVRRASA
ncbi:orotidine-5'-phosphate decarboxylase [Mycetocola sp. CAN_C7]|uniref:orotidine-5'-phosphate decarboxylase n=1 Tax=Mycetocola sp. CAN_C7 TaxID=2787724 RepID=UPI0018CA7A58